MKNIDELCSYYCPKCDAIKKENETYINEDKDELCCCCCNMQVDFKMNFGDLL